jgi:hypothetical protein
MRLGDDLRPPFKRHKEDVHRVPAVLGQQRSNGHTGAQGESKPLLVGAGEHETVVIQVLRHRFLLWHP